MAGIHCTCTRCGAAFAALTSKAKYCTLLCRSRDGEDKRRASPDIMARRAAKQRDRRMAEPQDVRQRRLAGAREYSERNRESVLSYKRTYYADNIEEIRAKSRARYEDEAFQAESRARSREWRKANPERKAAANKSWAQANPEKMSAYFRRSKAKRRENPSHRLYSSISAQLRAALNGRKGRRKWESLVGYYREDLIDHLERQFVRGMSWDNYGVAWHVDHITPQVLFELDAVDLATVRACWALGNLRPLWSGDNISKGARITHLL